MKILLTRTVPENVFYRIRDFLSVDYGEPEIYSVLQKSFVDKDCNRFTGNLIIEDGPFSCGKLSSEKLNELKVMKPDKLIVPANNGSLRGYDEFFLLAETAGLDKVTFITRHLNKKELSRGEYGVMQERIAGTASIVKLKDSAALFLLWCFTCFVKLSYRFLTIFKRKNNEGNSTN